MGVYIFTKKEAVLKPIFGENAEFLTSMSGIGSMSQDDIAYFDVSGISAADIKKNLNPFKKRCKDTAWGIIDPKGTISDPAALFFEGASDYLGPGVFKGSKKIDPKRLKTASLWRAANIAGTANADTKAAKGAKGGLSTETALPKTGIKLPAGSLFPGWENMQTEKIMPFYLLYCSLQGKTALSTRLGEKTHAQVRQRFMMYLFQNFQEGDGLVWMDTGKDFLFLLPPKAKNAEAAVKACLRMLASAPLATIETLNLTIPVNFTFALHYGSVKYKPPGKTGTVVSDAVNFVFHLGAKKTEPGRLTISDELPDGTIPQAVENCFVSAGEYEGRRIWHTKKFGYVKSWL